MIFIPIPLPEKVLRTCYCTRLFYESALQAILGMGMGGRNVTAQLGALGVTGVVAGGGRASGGSATSSACT